ncbi:MAG: acetoacetate--CoA ligase [Hyphomicrobiales bacterium]|nr:acetoacetate--CoA ligase [Hyphomicrobiales bacterium]
MDRPLWRPSQERIDASNIMALIGAVNARWGTDIADYDGLHAFSVAEAARFWTSLRDFAGVVAETWGETVIADPERIPGARFFPDARLNFAQNLLRRRDGTEALVFWGEDQVRRRMTWAELYDAVSVLARALRAMGLRPGDRVAAFMPNMPETIVAMLAAASVGAVWSSCSPDFGVQGVVDRFGQTEPRFLIAVEGYHYNGKAHDCLGKLAEIVAQLPTVERTVVVPYTRPAPDISGLGPTAVMLDDFLAGRAAGDIDFEQLPFNAPLYIMFSSGTTGAPKCIVHGAGGTLLQHLKEHKLHCDIKPGERLFYFTTCGWMMWNWLASGLAAEATLLLYDGSPFYPDGNVLFDFAQAEGMDVFGTSAKYIDALNKGGYAPKGTHDLSRVRLMTSTGSPLAPESFDYVYDKVKANIHLASISGGTDIISCFMLGNPTGPVWRGEIQAKGLGMATTVFDDEGQEVVGEKGELVCTNAFPSMPLGFWHDDDGSRYHDAYFARFPNVWCHGDFVEITEHGGFVIYGRSDAVLNPGGVRIGTAEIYRQVEKLDEVVEAIVIGQEWDNDTRVVLFVVLRPGLTLDDALADRIRRQIRANCTPRHVPARIVQVADIPRTKSGKITELAVRDVVHGRPVKNKEALANPEALDLFADRPELAG